MPSTALAHDGDHPFENCSAAYAAGYANIEEGDEHYGEHLDRDKDGIGCDSPPADFVPADDEATDDAGTGEQASDDGAADDTDLAETGGSGATPYLAGGGALVVLAGGGLVLAARKRRAND
ncbi:hypothetical protein ADL00_12885 [Streptomyces sp. AS58]|nr:hypothetical protein ADL00_12885 [Streptomyces sp. AS58]